MAISAVQCEEMSLSEFVDIFEAFLDKLMEFVNDRLNGPIGDRVRSMFEEVVQGLKESLYEIRDDEGIAPDNPELLCQIVWSIDGWDPSGPLGGLGGGGTNVFVIAKSIKEAVERLLDPIMPPEMKDLFMQLNQLLCMMRCF